MVADDNLLGLIWCTRGVEPSGDDVSFANSFSGGDAWSDRYDVGRGRHSTLTRADGLFHTIWASNRISDSNYEIYFSQSADSGVTWEAPTNPDPLDGAMRLTIAERNSWHPAIATNDEGINVVWADNRSLDTTNYEIYYNQSLDGGITWTHGLTGYPLTTESGTSEFPSISTYGNIIVIAWQDDRNGEDEIFFKHSTNNGVNWETDTYISAGRHPSITCDEDGVHIVWSDDVSETNSEIFYIQSTDWGTTWDSVTRLTYAEGSSESPKIIADDWGRHVIWKDSRGYNSLYYKQNDIIPPSAPTGLYVDAIGLYPRYATVIFDWFDNSEPDLEEYYAYRREGGQSWERRGSSLESYWQDNCNYDTHYWYYVAAVDMAKNESGASNIVHVYVPRPGSMMIAGIGNASPSPYLVQRTGYRNCGNTFEYTMDYDTEELIYRFENLVPEKFYLLALIHYAVDNSRIQALDVEGVTLLNGFSVTNKPGFDALWIPQQLYQDGEIQTNIRKVIGEDAVISEIIVAEFDATFEIYGGGSGGGTQTADENLPILHSILTYPNPARNDMRIKFGLPKEEKVSLIIYDVSGREIEFIVDKVLRAGYYTIRLDNMNLPSGIYFARLVTDNYTEIKKLVVMK